MKDEWKNKYIDRFFKISEESAKLTSQTARIVYYMGAMGKLINGIHTEGYNAGLKEGKKSRFDIKKN